MKYGMRKLLLPPKESKLQPLYFSNENQFDKMVDIINSDQIQDHLAPSVIFLMGAFGGKVINILLSSATNFGSTASILTSTNAHTIY